MRAVQPVWEESEGQQTPGYDQLPLDDVNISNRVNLAKLVIVADMDDSEWNTKEGD